MCYNISERVDEKVNLEKVPIREMTFHNEVLIPKELFQNTSVEEIPKVDLTFEIKRDSNQDFILDLKCIGNLVLKDARTLKPINYPFEIKFTEILNETSEICGRFLENSQNTLDILTILWENIVLEIPISYTESEELNLEGEGYKVSGDMSGEKIDPRLAPLLELLDKEKE